MASIIPWRPSPGILPPERASGIDTLYVNEEFTLAYNLAPRLQVEQGAVGL
jgi:hypothetical protein